MKKLYNSTGIVYGNYWGGGKGSYPAKELKNFESAELLIEEAKKKLKNGSLDSGMGYESLIGAVLEIEEIKTVEIEGEEFDHKEYWREFLGNLSNEELTFLDENFMG